jgi:hypothetical protein
LKVVQGDTDCFFLFVRGRCKVQQLRHHLQTSSDHFRCVRASGRRLIAFIQDVQQQPELSNDLERFVRTTNETRLKPCFTRLHRLLHGTCERLQHLSSEHDSIPFSSRTLLPLEAFDELMADPICNWKQLKVMLFFFT